MTHQRLLFGGILVGFFIFLLGSHVHASTPPTPAGYYTGGIFSQYFQNIVMGNSADGICPTGQAVSGFNTGNIISADYGKPICIAVSSTTDWSITGNAGTDALTNFLGTTDAEDLVIKTNNTIAARINAYGQLIVGNGTINASDTNFAVYTGSIKLIQFERATPEGGVLGGEDFNTALGYASLNSNVSTSTTGFQNTAVGGFALPSNTTGYKNTALGSHTLYSNTTGRANTAIGNTALMTANALYNTAIGDSTLVNLVSGDANTALGASAGIGLTSVSNGTFLGSLATANANGLTNVTAIGYGAQVGQSNSLILGNGANVGIGTSAPGQLLTVSGGNIQLINSSVSSGRVLMTDALGIGTWQDAPSSMQVCPGGGWGNTCYGESALSTNVTGDYNTAIGSQALQFNISGTSNTALGSMALGSNSSGRGNIAVGDSALYGTTTGIDNVAIGTYSMFSNSTGSENVAIGTYAFQVNRWGSGNIALGYQNSYSIGGLTGGMIPNTSIGYQALYGGGTISANTAADNVAIGYRAMYGRVQQNDPSTGYQNVAIGNNALMSNSSGSGNVAVGYAALLSNSSGSQNTAQGYGSMPQNTTGKYNVAYGALTLGGNTVGSGHTAVGYGALGLMAATGGTQPNTAIGYQALYGGSVTSTLNSGYDNVAIGYRAMYGTPGTASDGYRNIAIGNTAMTINTSGYSNVAIGTAAMSGNTTGFSNVAMGESTLYTNVNGYYNVALGQSALYFNSSGYQNTAVGVAAGSSNTTGYSNSSLGFQALAGAVTSTGYENVAMGYRAGYQNSAGYQNVTIGSESARNSLTAYNNTALGYRALYSNSFGFQNTAVGARSLFFTTGVQNSAVGYSSLDSNTLGGYNASLGAFSLYGNTTGTGNVGIGYSAGRANTSGSFNTIVGHSGNLSTTNLTNASAFGANAYVRASNTLVLGSVNGVNNATADTTVVIGSGASSSGVYRLDVQRGYINSSSGLCINGDCKSAWSQVTSSGGTSLSNGSYTGVVLRWSGTGWYDSYSGDVLVNGITIGRGGGSVASNTVLGYAAGSGITTGTNNIAIGYAAQVASATGNYQLNIGNWIYGSGGNIGIGVQNPGYKLDVNGDIQAVDFLYSSDQRLKTNIVPLTHALEKVLALRGYAFDWRKDGQHDIGVIAQEVEKIFPEIVSTNSVTGMKSVEYGNLVAPIIEAIRDLSTRIDMDHDIIVAQEARIHLLENHLATQDSIIASLQKRLEAIESHP